MVLLNAITRSTIRLVGTTSACLALIAASTVSVQAVPAKPKVPAGNYQKAAKELPKDLYTLYRVVERISRANSLDERPWRVLIVPKYDINAFATDVNLVAMYTGILDQLAGDSSAIACIVGHEMAHSVKRHIALGEAERKALSERIQKEAEEEVAREVNSANSQVRTNSVVSGILSGVLGGTVGNVGSSALQNSSNQRVAAARQKVQEIVKQKQEELTNKVAETSRKQEFEADESGYTFMAKAGFEPSGCLRAMEVLARTSGSEFDTTHPAVPKRIEALKQLMARYPASQLASEGKIKINASQPLTYERSNDGVSLRINSRFAGSTSDVDRLFGK